MSTTTTHYGWVQPTLGGDPTTWGSELNTDLGLIDGQVYANQQAAAAGAVPIGSITMFGGATPPANWLMCNGQGLSSTTYAALFNVIGYTYGGGSGTFLLPNLQQRFPLGSGPNPIGQVGGSLSASIGVANLPSHAHTIVDVQHNHGVVQSPHAHPDPGHTHGVTDTQHEHTMGGSYGYGVGAISPPNVLNTGGATTYTGPSGSGISIQASGANLGAQNANISLNASGTGLSTTQPTGSGTPLSVVPPFISINFIIRAA